MGFKTLFVSDPYNKYKVNLKVISDCNQKHISIQYTEIISTIKRFLVRDDNILPLKESRNSLEETDVFT